MPALYIPPAENMLIPRGTIGGAGQQPIIKPIIIILHTNASNTSLAGAASLMLNTTKGQEFHVQQEAFGTGRIAGRLGQYVDFTIRADNNYKANSFWVGGTLCGAISIETADHGTPYEKSWTDLGQRQNLEDLLVWLCQRLNIPPRRCPGPFDAGIGYHSMWGYNTSSNMNVNPWTNAVGKICPGPGKIREFPDLLASVARRVSGGEDWLAMATQDEVRTIVKAEMALAVQHLLENMPASVWGHQLPHTTTGAAPAPASSFLRSAFRASNDLWEGDAPSDAKRNQQNANVLIGIEELKAAGGGGGTVDPAAVAEATANELAQRLAE